MQEPRKRTVLIVDDDEDMRSALQHIFKSRGYHIILASDGQEAYELTLKTPLDAIITDVRMPKMNGVELLRRVKNKLPDLPVIFLITGFTDVSESEALRLGAAGFVEKPFNVERIVRQLEEAIARFTGSNAPL